MTIKKILIATLLAGATALPMSSANAFFGGWMPWDGPGWGSYYPGYYGYPGYGYGGYPGYGWGGYPGYGYGGYPGYGYGGYPGYYGGYPGGWW